MNTTLLAALSGALIFAILMWLGTFISLIKYKRLARDLTRANDNLKLWLASSQTLARDTELAERNYGSTVG